MEKTFIMLCCGAGMSSGFLANQARKAIKKRKLDVIIEARSHSDVGEFLTTISILMLGPHYAADLAKWEAMCEPYHVPVCVIPQDIYAQLDGSALVDIALQKLEKASS